MVLLQASRRVTESVIVSIEPELGVDLSLAVELVVVVARHSEARLVESLESAGTSDLDLELDLQPLKQAFVGQRGEPGARGVFDLRVRAGPH